MSSHQSGRQLHVSSVAESAYMYIAVLRRECYNEASSSSSDSSDDEDEYQVYRTKHTRHEDFLSVVQNLANRQGKKPMGVIHAKLSEKSMNRKLRAVEKGISIPFNAFTLLPSSDLCNGEEPTDVSILAGEIGIFCGVCSVSHISGLLLSQEGKKIGIANQA